MLALLFVRARMFENAVAEGEAISNSLLNDGAFIEQKTGEGVLFFIESQQAAAGLALVVGNETRVFRIAAHFPCESTRFS